MQTSFEPVIIFSVIIAVYCFIMLRLMKVPKAKVKIGKYKCYVCRVRFDSGVCQRCGWIREVADASPR